jgi:hypothetical protein
MERLFGRGAPWMPMANHRVRLAIVGAVDA